MAMPPGVHDGYPRGLCRPTPAKPERNARGQPRCCRMQTPTLPAPGQATSPSSPINVKNHAQAKQNITPRDIRTQGKYQVDTRINKKKFRIVNQRWLRARTGAGPGGNGPAST